MASPVLALAERNDLEGNLLQRWQQVEERLDEPRAYAYRPLGYPVLLGSVFKLTGYRPDVGPLVNAILYGGIAALVFLTATHWHSVASGAITVTLFFSFYRIVLSYFSFQIFICR